MIHLEVPHLQACLLHHVVTLTLHILYPLVAILQNMVNVAKLYIVEEEDNEVEERWRSLDNSRHAQTQTHTCSNLPGIV